MAEFDRVVCLTDETGPFGALEKKVVEGVY